MAKKTLDLLHKRGLLDDPSVSDSHNKPLDDFSLKNGVLQRKVVLPLSGETSEFYKSPMLQLPFLDYTIPADSLRFFDLETTGLHTASGSIAFLAGVGFIQDGEMVLTQLLLEGQGQEQFLVKELHTMLNNQFIVSYNGKSYDVPLLRSRLVFLHRLTPGVVTVDSIASSGHIDLLHLARVLYRQLLPGLRLGMMEEYVLGRKRSNDIDGALIPDVFFNWQREHDPVEMQRVVKHNELDIYSLVELLERFSATFESSSSRGINPVSSSRFLVKRGRRDTALNLLQDGYRNGDSASMKMLSLLYKKSGEIDDAVAIWQKAIETADKFDPFPYLELAKYYEHKEKSIRLAVGIVGQLSELLEVEIARDNFVDIAVIEDLDKRRKRLYSKLARLEA
jgi:uncharacterized protein YprB with RNaseH-like and TPR domain